MVVLLKIILALLSIANAFTFLFVYSDFKKTRKTEGFDELSPWEKLRFNTVFFFISCALISLFVFLVYYIVIPITIGNV
jgi:hypothetical protein